MAVAPLRHLYQILYYSQERNSLQLIYHVYGLHLLTNIEIPGLQPCDITVEKDDITVSMGIFPDEIVHVINQPAKLYYLEPGYEKTAHPPSRRTRQQGSIQ